MKNLISIKWKENIQRRSEIPFTIDWGNLIQEWECDLQFKTIKQINYVSKPIFLICYNCSKITVKNRNSKFLKIS